MFLFDAELGKSTKKAGKTKSGKTGKNPQIQPVLRVGILNIRPGAIV